MNDRILKFADSKQYLGKIARSGENNTRSLAFDCSAALAEYQNAQIIAVIQRPQGDPYTVTPDADGTIRQITLTSYDLEYNGHLQVELRVLDGDKILKSAIYTATVDESIRGEADAPGQPVRDVLDRLDAEIKQAQAVVDDIRQKLENGELNGKDAEVTAENIQSALGYAPVKPSELAEKQDLLTDADKQSITKTGMTSGAAWTSAEQKAARDRMGIAGFAEMNHITTIVTEEETDVLIVDLGKQCKICRFYYTFPEVITAGYTYVEVSNTNTKYYNMSGCAIGNKKYLDYIRIASALKPISIFAPAITIANESNAKLEYAMPVDYAMDETNGYRYLKFTTYTMKFPKNTTIEVYAV